MSVKIKSCPFCGSSRVESWETWHPIFHVQCDKCDAMGSASANKADAVEWWNAVPRRIDRKACAQRFARLQTAHDKARRQGKAEAVAKIKAEREHSTWAAEREAWLRAPIEMVNERWDPDRDDQ